MKLPFEIRLMVYRYLIADPRVIVIEELGQDAWLQGPRAESRIPPSIMGINREARNEGMRYYKKRFFLRGKMRMPWSPYVWFNNKIDVLLLSEKCIWDFRYYLCTEEVQRLACMLPPSSEAHRMTHLHLACLAIGENQNDDYNGIRELTVVAKSTAPNAAMGISNNLLLPPTRANGFRSTSPESYKVALRIVAVGADDESRRLACRTSSIDFNQMTPPLDLEFLDFGPSRSSSETNRREMMLIYYPWATKRYGNALKYSEVVLIQSWFECQDVYKSKEGAKIAFTGSDAGYEKVEAEIKVCVFS